MRFIVLFLGISCYLNSAYAQAGGTVASGGNVVAPSVGYRPIYMKDIFPDAMQPKSLYNYDGSPFIYDNWLLARLILPDDRIADSVYVKLNAYNKTLHFKDDNGEEMQSRVRIKQITIIDKNAIWQGAIFRTGYNNDPNAFFQVLADGKNIQLLKKMMILKWESKVLGAEDKRTLQLDSELYFAIGDKLYRSNKKCTFLAEIFETRQSKILEFISSNSINCNKEVDMKKIVDFINTL
jgi:hypothetical protein